MMYSLSCTIFVALASAFALVALDAEAQEPYPNRPVRVIVPFAPGGASDVVARIMAPKLSAILGRQIVVENRAGASGNIAMEIAARAEPDGYSVFLGNIGAIAINPAIFQHLAVNPVRDFAAVSVVADVPSILIAHPAFPPNSVREIVAYARANPGVLNFASTGHGALSRLEMEQLRRTMNIDVVHVPYKGGAGPAVQGLLAGETHVMFVTLASALSLIKAGRLKPIAISTSTRYDALPHVPTMTDAGFPDMVSGSWQGFFVPAGTPRPVIDVLHGATVATLATHETRERLVNAGVRVVASRSPEEFAAFVQAESTRWGRIARDAGAAVD